VPGLTDVDTTLALRKPEMRVEINRDRASDLGVNVQTLPHPRHLRRRPGRLRLRDNQIGELYDVWLARPAAIAIDPQAVANLTVPSHKSRLIKVGNIANIGRPAAHPRSTASPASAKSLSSPTSRHAHQHRQQTFMRPSRAENRPTYSLIASGRAKTQNESNSAFLMAFGFSLIFMYMILALNSKVSSTHHDPAGRPHHHPFALLSLIILASR